MQDELCIYNIKNKHQNKCYYTDYERPQVGGKEQQRKVKSRYEVNQCCSANEVGEYKYKCNGSDDDSLLSFAVRPKVLRYYDSDQEIDYCRKTACPKRI